MITDISVVICAYDMGRWSQLESAVHSVRLQTTAASQIIVVCDYNPDLCERARRELPQVTVVENTQIRGISGARNAGIAVASGQVVVFLDDDAMAEPDWLERLTKAYAEPHVLGVGGGLKPLWDEPRPAWFPAEFGWVVGCSYIGLPLTTARVRNIIGANMSARREVLATLGGFRMGFGKVGTQSEPEDTDICIRGQQQWPDGIWVYEPSAVVNHHVPPGRASWGYFLRRCYLEGVGKANLARNVGTQDGLSSERTYVTKVLPAGIGRGMLEAWRGDATGLARSAAIAMGLAVTMVGYGAGLLQRKSPARKRTPGEQPIAAN